jgi:CDP-diacylglycerol--glycerol-3-phosphate 3-phosphatidyltransferase
VLVRAGISPNTITVVGTIGVLVGAAFAARGQLVTAIVVVTLSSVCDLLDGRSPGWEDGPVSSVRCSTRSSTGWLTARCWARSPGGCSPPETSGRLPPRWWRSSAGSWCPTSRARAEGLGLRGETGFAPRFTRLKLLGVGGVLAAFDVPYGLEIVLWLLAALSYVTAWQRLAYVRAQLRDPARRDAPPARP